jgi:hypothetical protein
MLYRNGVIHITQYSAGKIVQNCPKDSRDETERAPEKFGEPDEVTPSFLIWYNRFMDDMCYQYQEYLFDT